MWEPAWPSQRGQDRPLLRPSSPTLCLFLGGVWEARAVALTWTGSRAGLCLPAPPRILRGRAFPPSVCVTPYSPDSPFRPLPPSPFHTAPTPKAMSPLPALLLLAVTLSGPLRRGLTVLVSVRGLEGSRPPEPPPPPPPARQAHQDQGQRQAQPRRGAEEQRRERQRGLGLGSAGAHRLLRLQRRPGRQAASRGCWRRGRGRGAGGGGEGRPGRGRVGGRRGWARRGGTAGRGGHGEEERGDGEGHAVMSGPHRAPAHSAPSTHCPLPPDLGQVEAVPAALAGWGPPWQDPPPPAQRCPAVRPSERVDSYPIQVRVSGGDGRPRICGPAGRSTGPGRTAWAPSRPCPSGSSPVASCC